MDAAGYTYLKLKTADFHIITRAARLPEPTQLETTIMMARPPAQAPTPDSAVDVLLPLDQPGRQECRACGAPMARGDRFCAACGGARA